MLQIDGQKNAALFEFISLFACDKDASNAKFFFLGHRLLTKRKSITLEQLKNVQEIFVFKLIKRLTLAKLTFFSLAPIVDRPLTPGVLL